jgi:hypothetical protein
MASTITPYRLAAVQIRRFTHVRRLTRNRHKLPRGPAASSAAEDLRRRSGSALPSGYGSQAARTRGRSDRPADPAQRAGPRRSAIRAAGRARASASPQRHLPRRGHPLPGRRCAGMVPGQPHQPAAAGEPAGAVPARTLVPRSAKQKLQYAVLAAAALHRGTEPDLLDEVAWWQTDDFWKYALYAALACIRAAASQTGVPVRQACQDLALRRGYPAP